MKIYQVGGFVRDKLLGIQSSDIDYLVVGSSVDEMLQLGFKPVGKSFPVFLHPITNEEYALARKEQKIHAGHTGFKLVTQNISLIDDLKRRDITINAIAFDPVTQEYIDPFGGIIDLHNKIIRHVSEHFIEDPLRILRVARFFAKLPNFTVANATIILMSNMIHELKSLSQERIKIEVHKALLTNAPFKFFALLNDINALKCINPIFKNMFDDRCCKLYASNFYQDLFNSLTSNIFKEIDDYTHEYKLIILYYYLYTKIQIQEPENKFINSNNMFYKFLSSANIKICELLLQYNNLFYSDKFFIPLTKINKNNLIDYTNNLGLNETINNIYMCIKTLDPIRQKNRFIKILHLSNIIHQININILHIDQIQIKNYELTLFLINTSIQKYQTINYAKISDKFNHNNEHNNDFNQKNNLPKLIELYKKNIILTVIKEHNLTS